MHDFHPSLMKKALRYVIDELKVGGNGNDYDFPKPEEIDAMNAKEAWNSMDKIFQQASKKREETEAVVEEQEGRSSEEKEGSAGSVEADRDRDREHE